MVFVWIESGTFQMGSSTTEAERNDNETLHIVILNQGFWLGKHAITQGQWEQVMGCNPSHFKEGGENCPVESIYQLG